MSGGRRHGAWIEGMAAGNRGFTLIELMVAMLLGLIVTAGVISVFLANQDVYRTNEALGDVQDSSRVAFETMAINIRAAGLVGCANNGQVANVLPEGPGHGGNAWWADWNNALRGYGEGTAADPALNPDNQVPGTDSLMTLEAGDSGMSIAANDSGAGTFTLDEVDANVDLQPGDAMIVCDPDHAALFRATSYDSAGKTVGYAPQGSLSNCSIGLGYPTVCTPAGTAYTFGANASLASLVASDWYIGKNPDGGSSLYRVSVDTGTGESSAQEMVRNVDQMDITYHQSPQPSYVEASKVTDWSKVDAVAVTFKVQSTDTRAGTDAKPIERSFVMTATVRNRVN